MESRVAGAVRLALLAAVLAGGAFGLRPLQGAARRRGWRLAEAVPPLFCRALCRCLNVRPRFHGRLADGPVLLVPNHVSWLDIPALGAGAPVAFVAKREVAGWPMVGTLARLQGAVFVDRARRRRIRDGNARIARRMLTGQAVVLFAEGTTGCGSRLRPFRTSHFEAARDALGFDPSLDRVHVQPVSIAYTRRHGLPLGRHGRPDVAWYGDMVLLPHLWGLLAGGPLDCDITFLEPIAVDRAADRKVVGRAAERAVRHATACALLGRRAPATRSAGSPAILIGAENP